MQMLLKARAEIIGSDELTIKSILRKKKKFKNSTTINTDQYFDENCDLF